MNNEKIIKMEEMVEGILAINTEARANDRILIFEVLKRCGFTLRRTIFKIQKTEETSTLMQC